MRTARLVCFIFLVIFVLTACQYSDTNIIEHNPVSSSETAIIYKDNMEMLKDFISSYLDSTDCIIDEIASNGYYCIRTTDGYQPIVDSNDTDGIFKAALFVTSKSNISNEYEFCICIENDLSFDAIGASITNANKTIEFSGNSLAQMNGYYSISITENNVNNESKNLELLHEILKDEQNISISFNGVKDNFSLNLDKKQKESLKIVFSSFEKLIQNSVENSIIEESDSAISNKEPQISEEVATKDDFDKIATNMTYNEVVDIIGFKGIETKVPEDKIIVGDDTITINGTTIFEWKGNGGLGSSITVIFLGNKVFSKVDAFLE